MRLRATLILCLPLFLAAAETTPKLYYSDVLSAPAGGYICVFGRNFPTQGSAILKLDGTSGDCTIRNSGGDGTFTVYSQTGNIRGTAVGKACYQQPTASGECNDAFSTIILNDGVNDSNAISMGRHTGDIFWVDGSSGGCGGSGCSDANNCTALATACSTIEAADDKASFGPGDQVIIKSATYSTASETLTAATDGSSSLRIAWRGYPGETPIIRSTSTGTTSQAVSLSGDFVDLVGVRVEATDGDTRGLQSGGASNRIVDVEINATRSCIQTTTGGGGDFIFGVFGELCGPGATTDHGVYIQASNTTVGYSEFTGAGGYGIQVYNPGGGITGVELYSNDLYNNEFGGVVIGSGVVGTKAWNNILRTNSNKGFIFSGDAAGCEFFNNTLYNNDSPEIKSNNSATCTLRNNIIYHSNGSTSDVLFEDGSTASLTAINYNLWHNPAGADWTCDGATKTTFAAWQACVWSPDTNGVSDDPDFVSAGTNFHAADSGGAIDRGTAPPSARETDYELGTAPLGSSHDVGVYEYVSSASSVCGNGVREAGDTPNNECDGADLQGRNCTNCQAQGCSQNYDGGTLACDVNCAYDETGCFNQPTVGTRIQ